MHRLSTASRVLRSAALRDHTASRSCSYYKHDSDKFVDRHIGPREQEKRQMVQEIGFRTLEEMIAATVPASIRSSEALSLSKPLTESQLIQRLQSIAGLNNWDWRSFIGMGYYQCHTPTVIVRNLLENPGIHHSLPLAFHSSFCVLCACQAGQLHTHRIRQRSHRGDSSPCSTSRPWSVT